MKRNTKYENPYDTVGTYKGDTIIRDGMGNLHDGMRCGILACPYIVSDVDGCCACYCDMYEECRNH